MIESECDVDLLNFTKCDIFTPDSITKLMTSKLEKYSVCVGEGNLLEPSVGKGNLLKYLNWSKYCEVDIYEIKQEYLDSISLDSVSLYNSGDKIKKYKCDFLKCSILKRYENIIMNPPYIRVQDLSKEYREYLRCEYNILGGGMVDIYYAFIIRCLNLLTETGVMISITPNSYLYNKSALKLRKYLFDNKYIEEIIDFKEKKVFDGVSVYCCITVFTKREKEYILYESDGVCNKISYSDITRSYSLFDIEESANVSDGPSDSPSPSVSVSDSPSVRTLRDVCKIRNGIATLRDKIYIHDRQLFSEPCWRKITNGARERYIIYPYDNNKIISEDTFSKNNKLTYEYLVSHKSELNKRDKGNKKYAAWYAYGRTQSIKSSNSKCIYIPCFLDPKCIEKNIYTHENILHSSCLCIEPYKDSSLSIDSIIRVIKKNIDFINKNSAKRSGGWINMSSRILYLVRI